MNLIKKVLIICVILLIILPINATYAAKGKEDEDKKISLQEMVTQMGQAPSNDDNNEDNEEFDNVGIEKIRDVIKNILGAIRLLTGLASIIMIAYTGFKMVVGDTPEGKNQVKKAMVPIVTGTLIVFSATSIATFIIGVFE